MYPVTRKRCARTAIVEQYAHEIAVMVVAKNLVDEEYSSEAITAMKQWLKDADLTLTRNKTGSYNPVV